MYTFDLWCRLRQTRPFVETVFRKGLDDEIYTGVRLRSPYLDGPGTNSFEDQIFHHLGLDLEVRGRCGGSYVESSLQLWSHGFSRLSLRLN